MEEGYAREGSQVLDKVLAIDPIQPNALNWRGIAAVHAGDLDLAERLMLRAQDLGLAHAGLGCPCSPTRAAARTRRPSR